MKRILVDFPVFCAVLGCLFSVSTACQSNGGGQPANPFAVDRQTAPPPATFSHQSFYLGQSSYTSQPPATNYTPSSTTTNPGTIPANVPLPAGSTPSTGTGYGSLNGPGATTFQTSSILPPTASDQGWAASASADGSESAPAKFSTKILSSYTPETAEKNLETHVGTQGTVLAGGETKILPNNAESQVVSSSQTFTQVVDDREAGPTFSEPKTVYAGQYQ